jgi:hypothetical protein
MDEWPFRGYMIKFSKIYMVNELEGEGYTNPRGWMNDYKGERSEDEW